ncbi:hypothetical protein SDC9_149132 [bioreactor metagenome]|uniref:Uncharacterized protein n=1 Tax=bioreactor metagenome TaxID=1076179 RepID=A0A645ELB3_9ZZZZ
MGEPPLFLEPLVERCTGHRHKRVEVGNRKFMAQCKAHERLGCGGGVGVVADDKGPVNHDAGIIDIVDDGLIVGSPVVDPLPHLAKIFWIQRLKADDDYSAAALPHKPQQLRPARRIHADLANPLFAQGNQGFKQLYGAFFIGKEVVVDKK